MADVQAALARLADPTGTSNGATSTWNSFTASTGMGRARAWPPGLPISASPKTSLLTPPSKSMVKETRFSQPTSSVLADLLLVKATLRLWVEPSAKVPVSTKSPLSRQMLAAQSKL